MFWDNLKWNRRQALLDETDLLALGHNIIGARAWHLIVAEVYAPRAGAEDGRILNFAGSLMEPVYDNSHIRYMVDRSSYSPTEGFSSTLESTLTDEGTTMFYTLCIFLTSYSPGPGLGVVYSFLSKRGRRESKH